MKKPRPSARPKPTKPRARKPKGEIAYSYDIRLYHRQGDDFAAIKGRSSLVSGLRKWAKDMQRSQSILNEIADAIEGQKVELSTADLDFVTFQAEDAAAEKVLRDLAKRKLLAQTRTVIEGSFSWYAQAPRNQKSRPRYAITIPRRGKGE